MLLEIKTKLSVTLKVNRILDIDADKMFRKTFFLDRRRLFHFMNVENWMTTIKFIFCRKSLSVE